MIKTVIRPPFLAGFPSAGILKNCHCFSSSNREAEEAQSQRGAMTPTLEGLDGYTLW